MISAAGIERYVKEETQKTEKNIGLEGAYKSSNRGGGGINEGARWGIFHILGYYSRA